MFRDRKRPRLCGRADELEALGALLEDAAAGHLQIVFVEGEAGIGKTRLVSEALEHVSRRGIAAHVGRAEELEHARPFGALADALGCTRASTDPARAALANMLSPPDVDPALPFLLSQDPGLQFRVVEAFVDLLESATDGAPAVLVLDDMQWSDPSTLIALRTIERRLTYAPLALVATMRPTPRSHELERLMAASLDDGAHHLKLKPLDAAATMELLAACVDARPGPNLVGQAERAAGNPLYIMELIRSLEDDGALIVADGAAEAPASALPKTLRLTFLRRIGFLPTATFETLQFASVLGSSFSVTDLSRALGRTTAEIAAVLRDAVRAGILIEDGPRLQFRHDLIREAVYEDLPHAVRLALHRDAAAAMIAGDAPAIRVAEHMALAAEPGDPLAVDWLRRAAQDAAPAAPSIAADLLERAGSIAGHDSPLADRILADRAASLIWAGRLAEGEAICRDVLARAHDSSLDGILWISLLVLLLSQGRSQEAKETSEAALATAILSPQQEAAVRAWGGHAQALTGAPAAAEALATAARREALALGDDFTVVVATACLAMVEEGRGHHEQAHALSDEACLVADAMPGRSGHRFVAGILRGLHLADVDRLDESKAAFAEGRRLSEMLGARFNLSMYQSGLVLTLLLSGDWDDAIAEFETGVELARETGSWQSFVGGYAMRSMIALHRDDLVTAEEAVAESGRLFAETGPQWKFEWLPWARAQLAESKGAQAEAAAILFETWDMLESRGVRGALPYLACDVVRLAIAAGDTDRAARITSAIEGSPTGVGWVRAAAARCRGLMDGDVKALTEAGDIYERCGRPLDCALSIEDAATAHARSGDATGTQTLLERAGAGYERLGATRDSARVAAALRALGVRPGTRAKHKRASTGWDSLTASEMKVARLVTEGLTNPGIAERLFISRLTVRTHLSHIFSKLGVASRTELAAAFARRG